MTMTPYKTTQGSGPRPDRINCPACGNHRSLILNLRIREYACGCGYAYALKG